MIRKALVVGCGQQKIWKAKPWLGAVAAKDAYTGPLFRSCRRYAERRFPSDWFVFSAHYGLIRPGYELHDYDVTFLRDGGGVISPEQLKRQCQTLLEEYQVVVSIAGANYNSRLKDALHPSQILELPLKSKTLFQRMKWLSVASEQ